MPHQIHTVCDVQIVICIAGSVPCHRHTQLQSARHQAVAVHPACPHADGDIEIRDEVLAARHLQGWPSGHKVLLPRDHIVATCVVVEFVHSVFVVFLGGTWIYSVGGIVLMVRDGLKPLHLVKVAVLARPETEKYDVALADGDGLLLQDRHIV